MALLCGCERAPALPPELATVKCTTAEGDGHASAVFAKARVTFVCISKRQAKDPALLRCDLNSYPMVCGDEGHMVFSRSVRGEVYAGLLPEEKRQRSASVPGLAGSSRLSLGFQPKPPATSTFEEADTNWQFVIPEAKELLPAGFKPVKGALCDRRAIDGGKCVLEAQSASLYWRIQVHVHADRGTQMTAEQYRHAMALWLPLLGKLATDPSPQRDARR